MRFYSSSKRLIFNVIGFFKAKLFCPFFHAKITQEDVFLGWGRKKSGLKAINLAKKYKAKFLLLEDGFVRSLNLGVQNSPSFSVVADDVGIYYDATKPSRLENMLNSFEVDEKLLEEAKKNIALIKKLEISKYNNSKPLPKDFFKKDEKRVLILTQVAKDLSLKYGLAEHVSTQEILQDALKENKDAKIYIKTHPDVLSGKKKSDFDFKNLAPNCEIIHENFNPIALLKHFDKVYTKTSGMGFEALLCGCECICYALPFYAGWGLTKDKIKCERRTRKRTLKELFAITYLVYTQYFNPYLNQKSTLTETLKTLDKYRQIERLNSNRLFFLGFSLWKRSFVKPFFRASNNEIIFTSPKKLLEKKPNSSDKIIIWGNKICKSELEKLKSLKAQIFFVEDGFLRSVSLGSDLTRPFSLIVDSKGLYIDPSKESDLEHLLQTYEFDENLLLRAKNIQEKIIAHKFSKYNHLSDKKLEFKGLKQGQKLILIPAQVEDDASMILGGFNTSTLELIAEVRSKNKDAFIVFKPHPDVLSGNRVGLKDESVILRYCDAIIKEVSIDSALACCDEVHTISSTTGFEALLRGKKVFTYGMPFYAGWGLSTDKFTCERRTRKLGILELIAASLILYPRYIHPKTKNLCEIEVCFDTMLKMKQDYFSKPYLRALINTRTFLLRKIRRLIEKMI